jgi:UDP-N-acetylglucosamine 2-epimerase (non-hydrolysing)
MEKVAIVFGTRPEAIKLAPVIHALRASGRFDVFVCATGQHDEMLQQVVEFFDLPVHAALEVMQPNQQLSELTARLLVGIDELLRKERPDCVMVQGDTTTTFAASLAAFYRRVTVLHVEAGLRTFNKRSPFPEETNRVMATRLADFHYAPTDNARRDLLAEGIARESVLVTGNTVIDALHLGLERIDSAVPAGIVRLRLDELKNFVLVTAHRRENHGQRLKNICLALRRLTEDAGVHAIFPVHLNPNVQKDAYDILGDHPLVHLTPPVAYPEFLWLMKNARLILTDSGGVQEEAPSLGKPVLLLRDTTERPEGVEAGTVLKVGSDPTAIHAESMRLLRDQSAYDAMAARSNPYGDGLASKRILYSMLMLQAGEEFALPPDLAWSHSAAGSAKPGRTVKERVPHHVPDLRT